MKCNEMKSSSFYKCVIFGRLRLSKSLSYYDQITVYRLSVAAYLGAAWCATEIPDMVGCVNNKLTTEVATLLSNYHLGALRLGIPPWQCGLEKLPQFSWSIFSPTMSPPLDRIGFKIPGQKNLTMSFWLMEEENCFCHNWNDSSNSSSRQSSAIYCCYNCNESLDSFANLGKLKLQIWDENWVIRNDFSIGFSCDVHRCAGYRRKGRVRKTAAEPAFMRKNMARGRIGKKRCYWQ